MSATEHPDIEPDAVLPDFSWSKIPKRGKIYQITAKYAKWL
jgi:hypothetical protein